MTTFDERNKGFENKFAYDEETAFKVHSRMKKQVGLWAAAQLGKSGEEAETYANELVQIDLSSNSDYLITKLQADFAAKQVDVSLKTITAEITAQTEAARKHILGK